MVIQFEFHYEMTPDNNDEILIPNNVLQIDLTENAANLEKDAVVRSGKLYDRYNHTFKFTEETVEVDIVWLFDWVDIPKPIQHFITARAAALVSVASLVIPINIKSSNSKRRTHAP